MDLLRVFIDCSGATILLQTLLNIWLIVTAVGVALAWLGYTKCVGKSVRTRVYEIDETTLGIGNQTVKIRPNYEDLQVAYRLWVELSTRKIGLPIDFQHDVIVELYSSWYEFFKVTRDLIKAVPVSKARRSESTKEIIRVAVEVLNEGLRPHLTRWQAKFRKWYEQQVEDPANKDSTPQEIQQRFPQYEQLTGEMRQVNQQMIRYAEVLRGLVFGP